MRMITETEFKALLKSDGWTHEQGYEVQPHFVEADIDEDGKDVPAHEVDGEVDVLFTLYSTLGDIRIIHEEPAFFVRGDSTAYSFDADGLDRAWPFETKVEGVQIVDEDGAPSGLQDGSDLQEVLPKAFTEFDYGLNYSGIVAEAEEKGYF